MKTANEYAHETAIAHIAYDAAEIVRLSQRIDRYASDLCLAYPFQTKMESALSLAKEAAEQALVSIEKAQQAYERLKNAEAA